MQFVAIAFLLPTALLQAPPTAAVATTVWLDRTVAFDFRPVPVELLATPRAVTEWALVGESTGEALFELWNASSAVDAPAVERSDEMHARWSPLDTVLGPADGSDSRASRTLRLRRADGTELVRTRFEGERQLSRLVSHGRGTGDSSGELRVEWARGAEHVVRLDLPAPAEREGARHWLVVESSGELGATSGTRSFVWIEGDEAQLAARAGSAVLVGREEPTRLHVHVREPEAWAGYRSIEWSRESFTASWDTLRYDYVNAMPQVFVFGADEQRSFAWRLAHRGPLGTAWRLTTLERAGSLATLTHSDIEVPLDPRGDLAAVRVRAHQLVAQVLETGALRRDSYTEIQQLHDGWLIREWNQRGASPAADTTRVRTFVYRENVDARESRVRQFEIRAEPESPEPRLRAQRIVAIP